MGFRIVEGPLSKKSSSVTAATNFTSTKHCEGPRKVFNGNTGEYGGYEYLLPLWWMYISAFLMSVAGQDSCYKWICSGRPAWQSCGVNRGCQKLAQNCSRQIPSKIMVMIIKVARVTFVIKLAMLTRTSGVASPILEDKRAILGEIDSLDCWDS